MRLASSPTIAGALIFGGCLVSGISAANAQGVGSRGSLGGYGGSMTSPGSGMGGSGLVIPYAGMAEGFMPYRMGGGSSLSYQRRSNAAMGSSRVSFSLSPLSSGMTTSGPGRMGQTFGSRVPMSSQFGGMGRRTPGTGGLGGDVMPPSFGYPFRQPPSLLSPSSAGAGMSM